MAVWLATSSSTEGLINADRFLGRTVLTSGMSVRGFSFQCKHAPVRIAGPFIMIAHVIGSLCIIHDLHNGQITRTLNNDCATRDKLSRQVRMCWRARTRRLMPLPQVS